MNQKEKDSVTKVNTISHQETGKVHIVKHKMSPVMYCYCSFSKEREPKEKEIDLHSENVCQTCARSHIEESESLSNDLINGIGE